MKKLFNIVCILTVACLVVACGSRNSRKATENTTAVNEETTHDTIVTEVSNEPEVTMDESEQEIAANNWDDVLDEYEEYADKYINCIQKAQNGDMSAMSDLASLMETARDLGDELSNASDDLSNVQIARYTRITEKFTSAMMNM